MSKRDRDGKCKENSLHAKGKGKEMDRMREVIDFRLQLREELNFERLSELGVERRCGCRQCVRSEAQVGIETSNET